VIGQDVGKGIRNISTCMNSFGFARLVSQLDEINIERKNQ
jgi:hypothetical protein